MLPEKLRVDFTLAGPPCILATIGQKLVLRHKMSIAETEMRPRHL